MSHVVRPGGRDLNPQQQEVLRHLRQNPVTVVGAGAGSGKTFTMISAALDVIERREGTLDQFALITFTNHAADHLRKELEEAVDKLAESSSADRELWRNQRERLSSAYIGTIHSYCSTLLRTFGFSLRIPRSASTTLSRTLQQQALTDELEEALIRSTDPTLQPIRELDLRDYEIRRQLDDLVGFCRQQGIPLEALHQATAAEDTDSPAYRTAVATLLIHVDKKYTELKRTRGVVDVNDLLLQTAELLSGTNGAAVASRIAERTRYLFVDEFQDTNPVQKLVIDQLIADLNRVLVVGDTKQSIFGFLAATPSMLRALADEQGVEVIPLELSRRPTAELLKLQNVLFASIKNNGYELEGLLELWPGQMPAAQGIATPLIYVEGPATGEAHRVGLQISLLANADVAHGDIVILAPTHRQLESLEQTLRSHLGPGIEVRREGGESLFDAPEVIATYHFLRMLIDEDDEVALYEALRTPYLRHLDFQAATVEALTGKKTLTDWFEGTNGNDLVDRLRLSAIEETVPQTLTRVFEETGLLRAYEAAGMDQEAANLQRLKEYARSLTRSDQALTLSAFTNNIQVAIQQRYHADPADLGQVEREVDYVRLLTIHAAKGLEFPYVLIPGLSRRLDATYFDPDFVIDERSGDPVLDIRLPARTGGTTESPKFDERMRKNREERVSEAMRLFYVAVTRAKQAVILFGDDRSVQPKSWQHEALAARNALLQAGARFI